MKGFVLGYLAGAATYHLVFGNQTELISELRGAVQRVDEKLAEMGPQPAPVTPIIKPDTEEPTP